MKQPKVLLCILIFVSLFCGNPLPAAGEIGFPEKFALSGDRSEALKQLIPGTREYYYYKCLHLQHQRRYNEVDQVLKQWIKQHNRTNRVREIETRQALFRYGDQPDRTLAHITNLLNLRFNHQRKIAGKKPDLPTRLDQNLISRKTLTARALNRYSKTLEGFTDSALDWVIDMELSPERRRRLLSRLTQPDYTDLVDLVIDDLNTRESRGFGSLEIHKKLLLSQLDECLKRKGDLINKSNFVTLYLSKLLPNPDVNWQQDPVAKTAYLDRLWSFASKLAPSFNSLKATILYHRLAHDRSLGIYDKSRFMTYIRLPRNVHYIRKEYFNRKEFRGLQVNLNADYKKTIQFDRIGSDEELVRSYLCHFFVKENSMAPYESYIKDTYLKSVFAETKIVNGIGDMERWYSMLSPSDYKKLKERIDIDFAPTNKTIFKPGEKVVLDLAIKNVKTMIVKVFEINTVNYYKDNKKEIRTDIDLDGLVANFEKTFTYDAPPLRRVRRRFTFPEIQGRGVFVVEFIGNGKSSRAVIRKGTLRFLERISTAGHIFTMLDEKNRKVPDASLLLEGHTYTAGDDGTINVPFTTRPSRQSIILVNHEFSCLDSFQHQSENYRLQAGIYTDREALLPRKKAKVVVRPYLYHDDDRFVSNTNSTPVTLSVLEDPRLVIQTTDREGVQTTKEVKGFKLFENKESTYTFRVPSNLSTISFTLTASIQKISTGKKETLSVNRSFSLNGINKTDKIEDLHLIHAGNAYYAELTGKTGEPKPDRPVQLQLQHKDFKNPVAVTLKTDQHGLIDLGKLTGIRHINAQTPEGTNYRWFTGKTASGNAHYPSIINARAYETISLPYMGDKTEPVRSAFSLLEQHGGTFIRDRFKHLAIKNSYLEIRNLPPGDYNLYLKEQSTAINIHVTEGEEKHGWLLSDCRQLEVQHPSPLHITSITTTNDALTVKLGNATDFTRVMLLATHYMPEYPLFSALDVAAFPYPGQMIFFAPETQYVTGRDMGDEYRYIVERKRAKIFPGNMLRRPELLLNPWAIRSTQTQTQRAKGGSRYGAAEGRARRRSGGVGGYDGFGGEAGPGQGRGAGFSTLDFLAGQSVLIANLRPEKDGTITIDRSLLGKCHQVFVLAVSPQDTVYREFTLPKQEIPKTDLRLADNLDPKKHFTEQNTISVVKKNETFTLKDIKTSEYTSFDTLWKVYALFTTLSGNNTLAKFDFILKWPEMDEKEKQEKYAEFACHELNFFLYKKDPAFFKDVILPYLKNKKDKTFLDEWFVGNDLGKYLDPWAFSQLNTVERILLAQRLKEKHGAIARHVTDLLDLIEPDIARYNHIFKTALKGRALEAKDSLFETAKFKATDKKALRVPATAATTAPGKPQSEAMGMAGRARGAERKREEAETREKLSALNRALAAKSKKAPEAFFADDAAKRDQARRFYTKLEKTKEWVENNYYHLPIENQNANLIKVNPFWKDLAQYTGAAPFYSEHFAEATGNFPEMMFVLSFLDLPFKAEEHKSSIEKERFSLTALSSMIVFHKEIKSASVKKDAVPVLVSQNYYKQGERYIHEGNQKIDNYITDEFLVHTVYGCHLVVTNPSSSRQKLEILIQVPEGSIPVANGFSTKTFHIDLEPYHTWTKDYFFYLPFQGKFDHYPVHASKEEKLVAFAKPTVLNVVLEPTKVDQTSWDYVSQNGTPEEVLSFLDSHNFGRVDLNRIAWRMKDKAFFKKSIDLLRSRFTYQHTLWSYAVKHNLPAEIREFLKHENRFIRYCGSFIDSELVTVDPVERKAYQHMEYRPLVNARTHRLGKEHHILNNRFYAQYMRLMNILGYRPHIDDEDLMSVTYYLLLQDRIEEALELFKQVKRSRLETKLQYDYFQAYLGLYTEDLKQSRAIAKKYAEYPVPRWRKMFNTVSSQLDEIEGRKTGLIDEKDRTQTQTKLADTEPSFDFTVEAGAIDLHYRNIKSCRVNYYAMDIELLFSRNPFVKQYAGQFAYIHPNKSSAVELDGAESRKTIKLPETFRKTNVMVEIEAAGLRKHQAYFANALTVQLSENYGQLKVTHTQKGTALPKVYVKVYARMTDGSVRFYKDGYTDLRGRFDYTSLSTNELDNTKRFSILILSDEYGAVVKEAAPPKQ